MPPLQRRRQVEEDAEDDDARRQSDSPDDGDGEGDATMGAVGGDSTKDLIKKLVRYAISCEHSRTPIRREGIREKVLGPQGREFKKVFDGAQENLRAIFGMEMIELPTKDRKILTMEQKRKAAKSQSQREAASNAYVLVSVLPENFRTAAILTPSKVQSPDGEAAYAALYTFIISIIVISGGELSDPRLRRHLTRLNAAENMPSLNPNNPNTPSEKTELVLQRMIKQGYLVRTTDTSGHGDEDTTTWHVGPRGKVEVDNEAIAKLVREVYGETNPDLENRIQASLKLRDQMTDAQGAVEEQEAERDEEMGNGGPGPGTRRRSARRAGNYDDEEE